LKNLDDDDVDIKRTSEFILENIKKSAKKRLGYYEMTRQKPWFEEGVQNYWIKRDKPKKSR
jgi:hypothetical protein